jgi:hypothetical protein
LIISFANLDTTLQEPPPRGARCDDGNASAKK